MSVRVVIGTLAMVSPGGTESYCLTVARALDRLGHDVTLFADECGPLAEQAGEGGFDIAPGLGGLPAACDAILANDAVSAGLLAARYPDTRLVYCVHSPVHEVQRPPLAAGLIDAIVAPSERFAAYARALALDCPVVRLTQPIDVERFAPSHPPAFRPRRALLLGNYLAGRRRDALVETWAAAGIDCVQVGNGDQVVFDVRPHIATADIVVGKARAALEGMACGKAVYVFDTYGGDGWVTVDDYPAFEADNFAGLATDRPVDRRGLAGALERYDPDSGWTNRELVVKHHNARTHAQALLEVLRGPRPRRADSASDPAQAARLVRSARRAQQHAARTAGAAAAIASERDLWRTRALDAEQRLDAARALLNTRRVRAGLALGRCLDRARR